MFRKLLFKGEGVTRLAAALFGKASHSFFARDSNLFWRTKPPFSPLAIVQEHCQSFLHDKNTSRESKMAAGFGFIFADGNLKNYCE
jgi:hypothetical protein